MELVDDSALRLKLRSDHARYLQENVKRSQILSVNGDIADMLFCWDIAEMQTLARVHYNINIPSPIIRDYKWPGLYTPFNHQKITSQFLSLRDRAFCFNEAGTGKTSSVIWAADYLMSLGLIRRVLIVCPLSIMYSAWQADIFKTAMHRSVGVAYNADPNRRRKIISGEHEFVITNYEGVGIAAQEIGKSGFDLIVVDEAQGYKTVSTKRWRVLNRLLTPSMKLWMLTGTPAAQSPLDAFGLAKLVAPSTVPRTHSVWRDKVMTQVTKFKWIPKPAARDAVFAALQPAIRFTKAECLDLPPVLYQTRDVPLTLQVSRYYKALKTQLFIEAAGEEISAVHAGAALSKLLQISCLSATTEVLTDSGWKYIVDITTCDKLWDGGEWVTHDGVAFMGVRPTESLDGVRMTHDHRVLTISGWQTCGDILNGEQSDRFKRAAIRMPNCFRTKWDNSTQLRDLVMSVRLWQQGNTKEPVPAFQDSPTRKSLWLPSVQNKPNSWDVLFAPVQYLAGHEGKMLRQARQRLQKLWRTWHNRVRKLDTVIRGFLGGCAAGICGASNTGQDRQQPRVQSGELSLGHRVRTGKQYKKKQGYSDPERRYDNNASCSSVWHKRSDPTCTVNSLQMACRKSIDTAEQEAVYDIVNAGVRNRFTVRGNGAPFVVHNCGAVYTDKHDVVEFDVSPRLKALMEVLDETEHKVLVFVPFRHTIDLVAKHLTKEGITSEQIHGDVSARERANIINRFQTMESPRVLVIQPQSASHGVTLTAANTVVFWSPVMSVETYIQCIARIDRVGQVNHMTVVHLQGSEVERKMYAMLQGKVDMHEKLVDLYRQELES